MCFNRLRGTARWHYDLLIVLLSFSLLPIHFYFDKRVDFRSLTTKQDSFQTGGIRT